MEDTTRNYPLEDIDREVMFHPHHGERTRRAHQGSPGA
jgi:hypothetical protein